MILGLDISRRDSIFTVGSYCAKRYERAHIRHTRTSYAGVAMSITKKAGEEAKGTRDNVVRGVSERLKKVAIRETSSSYLTDF